MRIALIAVCSCLLLAACGNSASDKNSKQRLQYKPTLNVMLEIDGNDATVTVETDMDISTEHYGMARKSGEGHIHMYLNNEDKIAVKENIYSFPDLPSGHHKLKVSLHNNDHTPYDVTKTFEFDIP